MGKLGFRNRWLLYILMILAAVCFLSPALAQEVFVIPVDQLDMGKLNDSAYISENLTASTQYIRLMYTLPSEAAVRLSVLRTDTGSIVLDKDYGTVSGVFVSDDIYLKFSGSTTIPYTISLTVGESNYTFPFYRMLMKLRNNTASTFGVRVRDLDANLTDEWTMATVLDLEEIAALPYGTKEINLCASNMYIIGTVFVRVRDGALRVSMQLTNDTEFDISRQQLYLITDLSDWSSADPLFMTQPTYEIGVDIPLETNFPGARYAVLYLPMTVTYDPNGLPRFTYNLEENDELQNQLENWNLLKQQEAADSVG